jgi:phage tail protein
MNRDLISVGKARLKVFGLNPQAVSTSSENRAPGRPTFQGMDYQLTGMGEKVTSVEAVTFPQVTGGLDCLGWLISHHEKQDAVNLIRLGPNYLGSVGGLVCIRNLDYDEDRFHPFTGVGRKVEVAFEMVHLGSVLGPSPVSGSVFGQLVSKVLSYV